MNYTAWLHRDDIDGNAAQLGEFAVYLWRYGMNARQQGNTYSTICGKLCAVRWYHRNHLGYDPGVNASHAILLRGIRRFTDPVHKQMPLTVPLLRVIRSHLDLSRSRHQLLWGGLLLGYFFLLRRSEYLYIGGKHHEYVLRRGNLLFLDAASNPVPPSQARLVGLKLSGAKNNQFGREEVRFLHCSGDRSICPVLAARWVVKAARVYGTRPDQPALSTGQGTGISSQEMSKLLKHAATLSGLDPSGFSTHSIRIGGATTLLNAGADRLVIKLLGRWLSNAFEDYPVLTADGTRDIARLMC